MLVLVSILVSNSPSFATLKPAVVLTIPFVFVGVTVRRFRNRSLKSWLKAQNSEMKC